MEKIFSTKFLYLLLIPIFFLSACYGGPGDGGYVVPVYVGPGIGLGTIIAVVVSWSRNKSILWAIIHGLLGWLYVIYALLVPKK
jgi:hypothetical protein